MAVFFRRRGAAPRLGKLASDYAVGESVFLPVNNVNTEFLVVHQGNPDSAIYSTTCDGTWLLMRDIYENRAWNFRSVNDYENSDINAYLNGDFYALLSAAAQNAAKQVKVPYRPGSGTSKTVADLEDGLGCKVFLLSTEEVGSTDYFRPTAEGAKLSFFADGTDAKRIAYMNGSATPWWMRSPHCGLSSQHVCLVESEGGFSSEKAGASHGIRPAVIINSDTLFDPDTNIIKE